MRLLVVLMMIAGALAAQPKRVLYFSHTAGFRHGSINAARTVLRDLAPDRIQVTASEDPAIITAASLRQFDAVFFFTSGEIALNDTQKRDLLDFVRNGGGFAGAHSASDTFYTWPEYGDLIGAYFDGHPWTQEVRVDVEDPDHPLVRHLAPSFSIVEEVYQHRAFDRANVRVLLTLDTTTVNLRADGVNRRDDDFALAWVRQYGRGRVFYTALGHFDEIFTDSRLQPMFLRALEWITGLIEVDASPRSATPRVRTVVEAAQFGFPGLVTPGAIVSLFGEGLTNGSSLGAAAGAPRLNGTSVLVDGVKAPVIFASPGQINALAPAALAAEPRVIVRAGITNSETVTLRRAAATPGIFTVLPGDISVFILCGGLGETAPTVTVNGTPAQVTFIRLVSPGLHQVTILPATPITGPATIVLTAGEASATYRLN